MKDEWVGVCPAERHKMTSQHAVCVSVGRLELCAVGQGLVWIKQMERPWDSVFILSCSHVLLLCFAHRFLPELAEPRVSLAAPQRTALPFTSAGDN